MGNLSWELMVVVAGAWVGRVGAKRGTPWGMGAEVGRVRAVGEVWEAGARKEVEGSEVGVAVAAGR